MTTVDFLVKMAAQFAMLGGNNAEAWASAKEMLHTAPRRVLDELARDDAFEEARHEAVRSMPEMVKIQKQMAEDVRSSTNDAREGDDWKQGGGDEL